MPYGNIGFLLTVTAVTGFLLSVIFGFLKDKIRQRDTIIQKQNESETQTRSVIANRLHSEVGGDLLGLQLKIETVREVADLLAKRFADLEDLKQEIDKITEDIQQTKATLAEIYESTYPRKLDISGLIPVCRELLQQKQQTFEGSIHFKPEGNFDLLNQKYSDEEKNRRCKTIQFNIYNLINLFVTNSVLHSHASDISVYLSHHKKGISLYMKDNGRGFDMKKIKAQSTGRGLFDIEGVLFSLDKKGRFFSQPGVGTELELIVEL